MSGRGLWLLRGALAGAAVALAAVRLAFFDELGEQMDTVFLVLVAAAVPILLLPWERLTSFKAAGVEISLGQPQVEGALESLGLDPTRHEQLRRKLSRLDRELPQVRGSRVLWIDDQPHVLVGVRRLLRSLGVDIVMSTSSEDALAVLERDSDFDALVTDIQREGESYRFVEDAIPIHEGTNFVVRLREEEDLPEHVRAMPVVFYAAYPKKQLSEFTRAARELEQGAEVSNRPDTFLPLIIRTLAEARAEPPHIEEEKVPMPLAGDRPGGPVG